MTNTKCVKCEAKQTQESKNVAKSTTKFLLNAQ